MMTAQEARSLANKLPGMDAHAFLMRMVEIYVMQAAPHKQQTHLYVGHNMRQGLESVMLELKGLGFSTNYSAGVLWVYWQ